MFNTLLLHVAGPDWLPDRWIESKVLSVDGIDECEVSHGWNIEEDGEEVTCAVAKCLEFTWE